MKILKIKRLIIVLLGVSLLVLIFALNSYRTSFNVNKEEDLIKCIKLNSPVTLGQVIEKKIISDKVYILYTFSSPKENVGVIILKQNFLFKKRFDFYANSTCLIKNYDKAIYIDPKETCVIYYGLNKQKISYYTLKYDGAEKRIYTNKKFIFDVYINDSKLNYNYPSKIFNQNNKIVGVF